MISEEFLNQIYKTRQNKVEENIQDEYYKRVKEIKAEKKEERDNIKMGIISELYYKEGFKDGIDFVLKYIQSI